MSLHSLSHHRRGVIISTVLGKFTKLLLAAFVVHLVYRAGLDGVAYALVFGGGGYALVRTISDWRNGRKPWHPSKRVQRLD